MPTVFDCFLYCGEADVLAIRVEELRPVVDVFVIVEATHTFQGQPRKLSCPELPAPVVRVNVLDQLPADPWVAEAYVRNAITRGLRDAEGDDIVLVSDADEIPRASVVESIAMATDGVVAEGLGPLALENTSYYYTLDWQVPWRTQFHPIAVRRDRLGLPHDARRNPVDRVGGGPWEDDPTVGRAGWHFGWLGGVDAAMGKLASFAHAEHRNLSRSHVEWCMREGWDLFYRGPLKAVEVDGTYPECVRRNPESWAHLLRGR